MHDATTSATLSGERWEAPPAAPGRGYGGQDGRPPQGGGGGNGGDGRDEARAAAFSPAVTGAWMLAAAVAMLFVGFTSTYLVRRTAPDWTGGSMPPLLYLNTAFIAAASAALEWGRARGHRGQLRQLAAGLGWACGLGAAFLVGQAVAWWKLLSSGVVPAGTPHSAFFYLLTGMHALHVAGGLGWLAVAWRRTRKASRVEEVRATVDASAVFWHFIGALWVYLWVLLFWV